MNVYFHKNFTKQLKKSSARDQQLVKDKLKLFLSDPFHPSLRNHALKGKYFDYRSIDLRGDLRALYKATSVDEAIFVILGTHGQLYK